MNLECGGPAAAVRDRSKSGGMAAELEIALMLFSCRSHEAHVPRIGLEAGLSGPTAAYGLACRRGAELAIDDLKARGEKIDLVLQDDQGSPEQTANVAASLVSDPTIAAIVGTDTSSGTMAMTP